jgi:hypothetical protein
MQNEQQSAKDKLRDLNMDWWTPSCLEKMGVTDFVSHLQFQEALYALCKGRSMVCASCSSAAAPIIVRICQMASMSISSFSIAISPG